MYYNKKEKKRISYIKNSKVKTLNRGKILIKPPSRHPKRKRKTKETAKLIIYIINENSKSFKSYFDRR